MGITQLEISFNVLTKQNNKLSEDILVANEKHLSKQCKILFEALSRGERLTTGEMYNKYHIGDGRRRIKDLRDNGILVKDEVQENRYKKYFL